MEIITTTEIENLIKAGLTNCQVKVLDPQNDNTHFQAIVISDDFEGLSRIAQHRLVYAALGDSFKARLHALALKTLTQQQAREQEINF